jgi:hypothetical protein
VSSKQAAAGVTFYRLATLMRDSALVALQLKNSSLLGCDDALMGVHLSAFRTIVVLSKLLYLPHRQR